MSCFKYILPVLLAVSFQANSKSSTGVLGLNTGSAGAFKKAFFEDAKLSETRDRTFNSRFRADTAKVKKSDTTASSSPRDGKYLILSFGSNPANPLKLGYFALSANAYKYYDLENKLLGDGTYVYDVADKQIKWQTGPFKAIGWSGDFSIEQNGKVHIIRLKNNTIGTNSVE